MTKRKQKGQLVDEKYKLYLYDLGLILKELAFEIKAKRDKAPKNSEERSFLSGELLGFNHTISILQQQADSFEIKREELRLDDVDSDSDLT